MATFCLTISGHVHERSYITLQFVKKKCPHQTNLFSLMYLHTSLSNSVVIYILVPYIVGTILYQIIAVTVGRMDLLSG